MDPALQIGAGVFEHGAMTGIKALSESLRDALERKMKALFFPEAISFFPRQSRLLRHTAGCRLVLLCLHGLALPTPGHEVDYSSPYRAVFQPLPKRCATRWRRSHAGKVCSKNRTSEQKSLSLWDIALYCRVALADVGGAL